MAPLPSLAALRALETMVRTGGLIEAARALNVTEAAIRQHIRALEADLGIDLMAREGRRIVPTAEGRDLAGALEAGFDTIRRAVETARSAGRTRPVRVALTPAFAETWLMPRLPAFWAAHPDIRIDLAPSLVPVDLSAGDVDMAIRYGHSSAIRDTGLTGHRLASADYTVVAAPSLAGDLEVQDIGRLSGSVWLFEQDRKEHETWAGARGIDFHAGRNRFYPTNSLVLSAARAGHGYSVQAQALVEADLEAGSLVSVYREPSGALGYYLLAPDQPRREAAVFARWLRGQTADRERSEPETP